MLEGCGCLGRVYTTLPTNPVREIQELAEGLSPEVQGEVFVLDGLEIDMAAYLDLEIMP